MTTPIVAMRVSGDPGGAGTFATNSASHPGHIWYVELIHGGMTWCACPAFTHRGTCRHAAAAASHWNTERMQTILAQPAEQREARRREIEEAFSR